MIGDRQVGGGHPERVQEGPGVGVLVGVDPVMGQPVRAAYSRSAIDAGENCDRMIAACRPPRTSAALAGQERLEHGVAEADVGEDPGADTSAGPTRSRPPRHPRRRLRALAGQQADLPEEPPGAVGRHHDALLAEDLHGAVEHDDQS